MKLHCNESAKQINFKTNNAVHLSHISNCIFMYFNVIPDEDVVLMDPYSLPVCIQGTLCMIAPHFACFFVLQQFHTLFYNNAQASIRRIY